VIELGETVMPGGEKTAYNVYATCRFSQGMTVVLLTVTVVAEATHGFLGII